jgi:hypothetical protein
MAISRREALKISGATLAGLSMTAFTAETSNGQIQTGRPPALPATKWWIDEPVRYALILYNQDQAPVDTDGFVQNLVDLGANAVNLPVAGVACFYPTKVPFHNMARSLPPGRDLVGEIVTKAHARNIRVVARLELDLTMAKGIWEAHPEWMQINADGSPRLSRGNYFPCINGGYSQEHIFKIVGEVLDRFPVDGMVFNAGLARNFTNDGKIEVYGPCQCPNCKRLFSAKFNKDVPVEATREHSAWYNGVERDTQDRMEKFVRSKSPDINYMPGSNPDSNISETHSAPLVGDGGVWPYAASEIINRSRTTYPNRMIFNTDSAFLDSSWRYAHRSAPEGELRGFQNMAYGAAPYIFVNGAWNQADGNGMKGARAPFQFAKTHEELYVRQENAARVLLLEYGPGGAIPGGALAAATCDGSYGYPEGADLGPLLALFGFTKPGGSRRGFFRILSEQHIPFALSSDLSWVETDPRKYDLVICPKGVPAVLDKYLRQGGRVLAASALKPELELPPVVKLWKRTETLAAYWRVRDRELLPSLKDTSLLLFYSDYLELEPRGEPALTLIPPSIVSPMELTGTDMMDSDKPGIHLSDYGEGKLAYIPWDLGDIYYRSSPEYHLGIVGDLVDHLMPAGRQLVTNAHPMVEMTLQQQKKHGRTNLHFINLTGYSQSAVHPAIPMSNIQVDVAGDFKTARMVSTGRNLPLRKQGRYVSFTLPNLDAYEVVALT